jgi:hypothetical protein
VRWCRQFGSYQQRATVVLSVRKAQQFFRHCERWSDRRSRRVKGPLAKKRRQELVGLTDLPAQLASPGVGPARLRRRLTFDRVQRHSQRNLQVKLPAVAMSPFGQALESFQALRQLRIRLGHGRAGDRLLPSLMPILYCLREEPCLGAVVGEKFGLGVRRLREMLLQHLSDPGVEVLAADLSRVP